MAQKIRKFINACTICAKHKYERKPYNIKISARPIQTAPFQRIHMDIFGIDKNYFLSLICAFSKHLQLIKIATRNATDIQSAMAQYFSNFGIPQRIICDHESSFTSIQIRGFLSELGVSLEFASSSESNGQIEKTHSTIIEIFNTNKHKFPDLRSEDIITTSTALYNDTVHSSTSFTPNEVVFNHRNVTDRNEISEAATKIFDEVMVNLETARRNMEKNNHTKEDAPTITPGQDVLIKKVTRKKLDPRFTSTKCVENNRKTIKIPRNVKRNKNKLKRIRSNT